MKRSDLIRLLAQKANLSQAKASEVVKVFFDSLITILEQEKRIELRRFGTFELRKHAAYETINPSTGDRMQVGEKTWVHFKMSQSLRKELEQISEHEETSKK